MAQRPVFMLSTSPPYFQEELISFQYFNGFAESQKKKSVASLHTAFLGRHQGKRILEISSMSENDLGVSLSAFNLKIITAKGKSFSVESAFQSSKVFERGGPYKDLLEKTSREAKRDPRLKESGKLLSFHYSQKIFPLRPVTYFYNWLYINTLHLHPDLAEKVLEYSAFTDIAFNPDKSINCQARAAAVYVSLQKQGLLTDALKSPDAFLNIVYDPAHTTETAITQEQISFWDTVSIST